MQVDFGAGASDVKKNNGARTTWDEHTLVNGHVVLVGDSGMGKTHTLRHIIQSMQQSYVPPASSPATPLRIHVFDVHDDIEIPGSSDVLFSESSKYGLNPLIVNPHPHFGGVRKKVSTFISTINKASRALGDRQESVLRQLLNDLYEANGYYEKDPNSWLLNDGVVRKYDKKHPTLEDLYKFSYYKYKNMFLGTNQKCAKALDAVNANAKKRAAAIKNKEAGDSHAENVLEGLKDAAIAEFSEYVTLINTGRELEDIMKYDSIQTVKSVLDRISNLKSSGVFKDEYPPFDRERNVWRYRLNTLNRQEKKMFVLFRMEEIYAQAVRRGLSDSIVEVVVLDESHIYYDGDTENIINIFAREIRKFGVSLICASQNFDHFSKDFLSAVACKVILGLDPSSWAQAMRLVNIEKKALEWIVPTQRNLIYMKRKPHGDNSVSYRSGWIWNIIN